MANDIISELPVDLSDVLFRIIRGADWTPTLYFLDNNENPENTTGWSMEVKIGKLDGTIIKTLTTVGGGGIVNTPAAGRFDITYAAADTALLMVTRVKVSVKTTDSGGGVDYVAEAELDVDYPL